MTASLLFCDQEQDPQDPGVVPTTHSRGYLASSECGPGGHEKIGCSGHIPRLHRTQQDRTPFLDQMSYA